MIKNNLLIRNNIQKKYLDKKSIRKFDKEFKNIFSKINLDINNPQKSLSVLGKKFKFNFKIKDLQKFNKYKTVAVIGMGGSIVGSEAIKEFLAMKIKKKIYFFDDLDEKKIFSFKKKNNLSQVLFLVISKSGNTVETLSTFLSLNIIKKKSKNIIIISENKNNLLFNLSKKFNLFYVEHKKFIGGRFSVLSEVGIIPAYIMGVDIINLRANLLIFLKGKQKQFLKNSSIKLASLLYAKKISNLIFLNYSPSLKKFLFWCQQLIAESLGKKGKGFLPVISSMPKDNHSLLQLYLDGPKDKIFYIFSQEEKLKEQLKINKHIGKKNFLMNKNLSSIKFAQKNALIKVFKKNNIPFREFNIKALNEETLGKLFSYFMLEIIIIGKLTKINPYDQPAVEQIKVYTKKLLS